MPNKDKPKPIKLPEAPSGKSVDKIPKRTGDKKDPKDIQQVIAAKPNAQLIDRSKFVVLSTNAIEKFNAMEADIVDLPFDVHVLNRRWNKFQPDPNSKVMPYQIKLGWMLEVLQKSFPDLADQYALQLAHTHTVGSPVLGGGKDIVKFCDFAFTMRLLLYFVRLFTIYGDARRRIPYIEFVGGWRSLGLPCKNEYDMLRTYYAISLDSLHRSLHENWMRERALRERAKRKAEEELAKAKNAKGTTKGKMMTNKDSKGKSGQMSYGKGLQFTMPDSSDMVQDDREDVMGTNKIPKIDKKEKSGGGSKVSQKHPLANLENRTEGSQNWTKTLKKPSRIETKAHPKLPKPPFSPSGRRHSLPSPPIIREDIDPLNRPPPPEPYLGDFAEWYIKAKLHPEYTAHFIRPILQPKRLLAGCDVKIEKKVAGPKREPAPKIAVTANLTDAQLKKMYNSDWKNLDLSDYMSAAEQAIIQKMIFERKWYNVLRLAHVTYSCGSEPLDAMTCAELIRFLKQCKVVEKDMMTPSTIASLFSNVNVREANMLAKLGSKSDITPDKSFSLKELIVFLILGAIDVFKVQKESGVMDTVQCVITLFEKFVIPNIIPSLPSNMPFRRFMDEDDDLRHVVSQFDKPLKLLFKNYSGANVVIDSRDDSSLDSKELALFMEDFKLFDNTLTKRVVWQLFVLARNENDLSESYSLAYPCFLELMLRCACYKYGNISVTGLAEDMAAVKAKKDVPSVSFCAHKLLAIVCDSQQDGVGKKAARLK